MSVTIDLSRLGEGAKGAESALGRGKHGNAPVHLLVAHDADEQARNLYGWRQTYDQLTAGRFFGTLRELRLDQMQLFCETTSQTLRQSCEVQSEAYWFGIPLCGVGLLRSMDTSDFRPSPVALGPPRRCQASLRLESYAKTHAEFPLKWDSSWNPKSTL